MKGRPLALVRSSAWVAAATPEVAVVVQARRQRSWPPHRRWSFQSRMGRLEC